MLHTIEQKLQDQKRIYFYISIITIIVYSNSIAAPFTLDDFRSITANHAIRDLLDFSAIWGFYSNRFILYYTISLNYFFNGYNVVGYHVVNILIHIFNGILVYKLLKLILGLKVFTYRYTNIISLTGAILFIGHPVQVNAVTYIIQRTAALAATFYIMSVLYFIKYILDKRLRHAVIMFVSIVLAMYTKESTFSIPFMLLAVQFILFPSPLSFKFTRIRLYIKDHQKEIILWCMIFATLAIIPLTKMFQGGNISDPANSYKASTDMSRYTYLLTEFNVIITYIRILFLPINLNLDYDYPLSHSFFQFPTYISFTVIVLILLFAAIMYKKNRLITLGIAWFFIGLSVESSLIAINDVIFEHRLYFPLVGYVIFLVGLLQEFKIRKFVIALLCVSILSNFVLTYKRNEVFSSDITLWEDVVKKSPNKWRSHSSLGSNYLDAKEYDKAERELKKAIELNGADTTAYINLSKLYINQGNYSLALDYTEKVISIDKSGYGYYYRGVSLYKLGCYEDSKQSLLKSIGLNSQLASAYKLLGDVDVKLNNYAEAVKYYKSALVYSVDENEIKEINESIRTVSIDSF